MSYVTIEDNYVEFSLFETGKKISVKSRYVDCVEQKDRGSKLTTVSGASYDVSADYEDVLALLVQSNSPSIRKSYSVDDAIAANRRERDRPKPLGRGPQPQ